MGHSSTACERPYPLKRKALKSLVYATTHQYAGEFHPEPASSHSTRLHTQIRHHF
jgi:hypothetical protein